MNVKQSSEYLGIGRTTFDGMVKDGFIPKPKVIKGKNYWTESDLDKGKPEIKRRRKAQADSRPSKAPKKRNLSNLFYFAMQNM